MATLKQIAHSIKLMENSESRLDTLVIDVIEHSASNGWTPEAPNMLMTYLVTNGNSGKANWFRTYVREATPLIWNDKAGTFKYRKAHNTPEFHVQQSTILGVYWRHIQAHLDGATEKKEKPKPTLDARVSKAIKAAESDGQLNTDGIIKALTELMGQCDSRMIVQAMDKAGKLAAVAEGFTQEQAA